MHILEILEPSLHWDYTSLFHRCSISPFLIMSFTHETKAMLELSELFMTNNGKAWKKQAVCGWMCTCITEHARLIRWDEVYSTSIRQRSAGVDRRGLLLLAAFPSLSPLPLPHPLSFTLSSVWNSFLSGCSHHHISVLLTQPSSSVVRQASVLPFLSFTPLFLPHADDPWGRACHFKWGVSLHWICWAERWVSAFAAGAPEIVGHRWCRLHPSGAAAGQRTSECALCWEQTEEREDRRQQQREGSVQQEAHQW